jgi:hypothetical protein
MKQADLFVAAGPGVAPAGGLRGACKAGATGAQAEGGAAAAGRRYAPRRERYAPRPGQTEVLWPPCVAEMADHERQRLAGNIPPYTWLTVTECCRRLRCDSNVIYRHIQQGTLHAVNISSGAANPVYRVSRAGLVEWLYYQQEGAIE